MTSAGYIYNHLYIIVLVYMSSLRTQDCASMSFNLYSEWGIKLIES